MDNLSSYTKASIKDASGKDLGSKDLDDYGLDPDKDFEQLFHVTYPSNYATSSRSDYEDYITVYKIPTGYAIFEYICGGYSSYTFDPTETLDIVETGSFDVFWNMGLTNEQRDHIGDSLDHLRTEAGGLIYG